MKTKRGFTLIEILIALTIIGGFFSFGYANFRDYSRRQQTVSSAREIETAIGLTQQLALSGEKPTSCATVLDGYKIEFNDVQDTYSIKAVCGATDISVGKDNITLATGVGFSLGQADSSITFKTLGEGTDIGSAENFVVNVSGQTATNTAAIQVSPSGEVSTTFANATPSPTATASSAPTPSPTPGGNGCRAACSTDDQCAPGYVCNRSKCVNPSCPSKPNCIC